MHKRDRLKYITQVSRIKDIAEWMTLKIFLALHTFGLCQRLC